MLAKGWRGVFSEAACCGHLAAVATHEMSTKSDVSSCGSCSAIAKARDLEASHSRKLRACCEVKTATDVLSHWIQGTGAYISM